MGYICDLVEAASNNRAMLKELKELIKQNKSRLKEGILYFCFVVKELIKQNKSRLKEGILYFCFVVIVLVVIWRGYLVFLNYFYGTCDVDTFRWVFSTLAQVFGAILGLYIVAIFYVNDKFCDAELKVIQIRPEKSIAFLEEIESTAKGFWNTSMGIIMLFVYVIIYSIIILSLSNALIDTNFDDFILFYFGIVSPSVVMIILIIALRSVNSAISFYNAALKLGILEEKT